MTKPAYKFPERSRANMVDAILSRSSWHDRRFYLLSFNVKAHMVDLSFDNLLKVRTAEAGELTPVEIEAARAVYARVRDDLFDAAVERARESLRDDDAYQMHADGTECPVTWEFHGRNGGYAVPVKVDGRKMDAYDGKAYAQDMLMDPDVWSMADLRALYKLAVIWSHDLGQGSARVEIEYRAVDVLFESWGGDAIEQATTLPDQVAVPVLVLTGGDTGTYATEHHTVSLTVAERALNTPEQLSGILRARAEAAALATAPDSKPRAVLSDFTLS